MSPRFARSETRERALQYLRGLVSSDGRRNGWTLAGAAGEHRPDGMQRLLTNAAWAEDRVRDDARDFAFTHVAGPGGALVVVETGFVKKGSSSAGVERQFCPDSRRVENCQLGMFAVHSTPGGPAVAVDRDLYVPGSWSRDLERCARAGVPGRQPHLARHELARGLVGRTLARRPPLRWVLCPAAGTSSAALRDDLDRRGVAYALDFPVTQPVPLLVGRAGAVVWTSPGEVAATLPEAAWRRSTTEPGGRWACVRRQGPTEAAQRWLLLRRSGRSRTDVRALECVLPLDADAGWPREVLGHVAGARAFHRSARALVGLDHYEVRSWRGWYRHMTLALAAHACVLAAETADAAMARPA